jgi:nucleoside-diphosphate-sugar epimerase
MNVLVTGGSGTIGSYVLRDLREAGHALTCYGRTMPPLVEGVAFLAGDIMELDRLAGACQGHDAVVHLAAVPGPRRATPERLMTVNVIGTVHVLEAAVRNGIRKVVFASSGLAFGRTILGVRSSLASGPHVTRYRENPQ